MGRRCVDETRAKISAAMLGNKNSKGWKRPQDSRDRIAAKMLGNKNKLGHKDSPETAARKRYALGSPKVQAKRSRSLSRAMRNPLTRARVSAANAARKGILVLPAPSLKAIGLAPDYRMNRVVFYRPEAA